MIKTAVGFIKGMATLPKPLWVWIGVLMLVNMVVPFFFFSTLEAKAVLATTFLGALTQMAIFRARGFVRLLGLGHIYWVPLLPWLFSRLVPNSLAGDLRTWIWGVLIVDGISLVIDTADVVRYATGDRTASYRLGDP